MVERDKIKLGDDAPLTIGIIGFGPKGLYGLENLLAQIRNSNTKAPISIHLFNRTAFFGSGDIYRQDQPEYLIMNYANHNIKFNSTNGPQFLPSEIDDYVQWLSKREEKPENNIRNLFSSRASVGKYLSYCFKKLYHYLPNNVKLTTHVKTITKIHKSDSGYTLESEDEEDLLSSLKFHKVLITTGHYSYRTDKPPHQEKLTGYIHFVYPVEQLGQILPKSKVAIKGMGLTFIDTALSLTEGRGGIFSELPNGYLKYKASGKEPLKVYPFSRTGLPMIPRNGSQDVQIIPPEVIKSVLNPATLARPCSFMKTVLPKIKRLCYYAFYTAMFEEKNQELIFSEDFSEIKQQVAHFHLAYPNLPPFSWEYLEDPFHSKQYPTHDYISDYIKNLIQEAKLGVGKSPLMSAVSVWRQISPIFNSIYSFGGLDAPSQHKFDSYYFGLFNRLAYGPPLQNVQKILALQEAGIIDFTYAKNTSCTYDPHSQVHVLNHANKKETVTYMINARIPRATEGEDHRGLFYNLMENGIVRPYTNKTNGYYKPGYIDLNKEGNPYSKDGKINKDIAFYGTPTEGITFDNDTLSRERNNFATQWAKNIITEIRLKLDSRKHIKTDEIF
ncbi:FAD/NAD(P)-binding protein [Arenibacter certesii]|uniref:Oxidoreductase n=1 Tax=Arenibacter certesii TaxID=228955 RepID=A0A918J3K1_9FLAO|nr:FAD/NAD(P)-binding protein [Arenibacter certesii]GGW45388.1 oxidoreductase [Arenibacter certesii]